MRFPMPCRSEVAVKKYAIFAIAAGNPGWVGGTPVNSMVICTIATVAPAAKKLHMNIAKQVRIARYTRKPFFLCHGISQSIENVKI